MRATDRSLRWESVLLNSIGLGFVLFVVMSMILGERPADFLAHIDASRSLTKYEWISYSVSFPILHVATLVGSTTVERLVLIAILTAALMLRMSVTTSVLRQSGVSLRGAQLLSLGLLGFMPLLDPRQAINAGGLLNVSAFSDIYLGQFTPNVWHNSTTILMAPFALLAAHHICRFGEKATRFQLVLGSLFLVISAFAKPNYVFAAVPAISVFGLFLFRSQGASVLTRLVRTVVVIGPALLVAGMQFLVTFIRPSSGFAGSVIMRPLAQWGEFTDNYFGSTLRSILLPSLILALLIVFRRGVSMALAFSWMVLVVAISTFSLFVETWPDGSLRLQGNLSWGIIPAFYILLVYSLRDWYSYYLNSDRGLVQRVGNYLVFGLFAVHVAGGVAYAVLIATGKMSYAS